MSSSVATENLKSKESPDPLDRSDPRGTAGRFLNDCYGHPDCPKLVYHAGLWYAWNGRAYVEIDPDALRSRLGEWLAAQTCRDARSGEVERFCPTRRDKDEILDALRDLVYLETPAPVWRVRHEGCPAASDVLVGVDGILDL